MFIPDLEFRKMTTDFWQSSVTGDPKINILLKSNI